MMICQTHSKKRFAICKKCKSQLCLNCILEKHQSHLEDVIFINNILLLIHSTKEFMCEFQKFLNANYNADLNILIYLNEQLELYQTQLQGIFQNNEIECSLDFLLSVIQNHFQRNLYFSIVISNNLDSEKKIVLKEKIEPYFKKVKIQYLYAKTYDMYYLLLNYGNNKKALAHYKQSLQQLMEKTIFKFEFLESLIKRNYVQIKIECDEFFNIQLGRNYFYISEYEKCIKYMDQFDQNDEASIYKGLSLMFLSKLDEARAHFENLRLHKKYYYLTLFIKGHILQLQKKFKECIPIYEKLYSQFQYSLFFRQFCYFLLQLNKMVELKILCQKAIKQDPNNYQALFYKAISMKNKDSDAQYENIVNKLIKLDSQIISGQVLKAFNLLIHEKREEAADVYDFILQRFSNQTMFKQFVNFFKSLYLFINYKYRDAYLSFQQLPEDFFHNQFDKLFVEIIFLLKYQNLPVASRKLLQGYKDQTIFYQIMDQFCSSINECGLSKQALHFTEGFRDEIPKGGDGFYHVLRGKLQLNYNISMYEEKLKEEKKQMIEEAMIHLNGYSYDNSSMPFRYYYTGQALMFSSQLEEAADFFKKALETDQKFKLQPLDIYINLCVCEFMQGHIDKAEEYLNQSFLKNLGCEIPIYQFMIGMIDFLRENYQNSLDNLQKLKEIPLIDFIISWIYKEQNKIEESKKLIKKLDENHSEKFKCFCEKYTFVTSGLFSTYLQENQEKFKNFDNKSFFSLKIVAFYLDTQPFLYSKTDCIQVLQQCAISALIYDLQRSQKQKQNSSLQNYPFL